MDFSVEYDDSWYLLDLLMRDAVLRCGYESPDWLYFRAIKLGTPL